MTSQSDDNTYYVNEYGVRAKNQWISVANDDDAEVNGETVETLWYYFGDNGKAFKSENGDAFKKKTCPDATGSRTYFFDSEGHMASGWITVENGTDEDIYYCGTENEGWAYTGWQYLEPSDELASENYDDMVWFNFKSSGKARKAKKTEGKETTTWYNKGRYYTFDRHGVMTSDWYDLEVASNNAGVATGTFADKAYTAEEGTKGTGWVYTENAEESDSYWYYLVSFTDKDGAVRNVPFNSVATDGLQRAKVIKGKTYLFASGDGHMLKGRKELTASNTALVHDNAGGAISKDMTAGYYYFTDTSGSAQVQMVTGKTTVEDDGEIYNYYFDKKLGVALKNTVKDGVVYGPEGDRVDAEDGNTNAKYIVTEDITYNGHKILKDSVIIVSSTGKLRTSGSVKVDGVKYDIHSNTKEDATWTVTESNNQ